MIVHVILVMAALVGWQDVAAVANLATVDFSEAEAKT